MLGLWGLQLQIYATISFLSHPFVRVYLTYFVYACVSLLSSGMMKNIIIMTFDPVFIQTVPFGVLCFFSSYKMMEKLTKRWQVRYVCNV